MAKTDRFEKGEQVEIERLGKVTRCRIAFLTENIVIVRDEEGRVMHVRFDGALNDWTCGGARTAIRRRQ